MYWSTHSMAPIKCNKDFQLLVVYDGGSSFRLSPFQALWCSKGDKCTVETRLAIEVLKSSRVPVRLVRGVVWVGIMGTGVEPVPPEFKQKARPLFNGRACLKVVL